MSKSKIIFLFILIFSALANAFVIQAFADDLIINSMTLYDLDSGSTYITNDACVGVTLDVTGSPAEMILSIYSDFHDTTWLPYANPTTYTFASVYSGPRTVYCKLRDASLQESNLAQDTILMDVYHPHMMQDYCKAIDTTTVDLAFNEQLLNGEDASNYTIDKGIIVLSSVYLSDYYPKKYRLTTTPQTPGVIYTVTGSINLMDIAGNFIDPDDRTYTYTAPPGGNSPPIVTSFSIEGGAAYTNNTEVNIAMTESDPDGVVVKWLINESSSQPPPSDFVLTERPTSYILTSGEGVKNVYAWVMDDDGAVSQLTTSSQDSIILDITPPVANAGPDQTVTKFSIVTFDGSLSYDNYEIAQYIWNFGDNTPLEEGVIVTHVYTQEGIYTASLTVYDAAGNGPSTDYATITVRNIIPHDVDVSQYVEAYPYDEDLSINITSPQDGETIYAEP